MAAPRKWFGTGKTRLAGLAWAAILLAIAFGQNWRVGAFSVELSSYPDEPAHFVTGLMVDQYIRSDQWAHPLEFAQNYYVHYPKVAMGHWPPLYYGVQALWTLILGPSREAVISLQTGILALTAWIIFVWLRKWTGDLIAALTAVVYMALPTVAVYAAAVMLEQTVALLAVLAMLAWCRYLDKPNASRSSWFFVFTVAGVLTKGDAWVIAPAAIATCLLLRRIAPLLTRSFWLGVAIAAALTVPAQLWTMKMVANGWEAEVAWGAIPGNTLELALLAARDFGPILATFVLWGLVATSWKALRRPDRLEVFEAGMLSLGVVSIIFHAITPTGIESRRVHLALAPLLMLSVVVVVRHVSVAARSYSRNWSRCLVLACLVGALLLSPAAKAKVSLGYRQAAFDLVAQADLERLPILIASDALGEGLFISEVAMLRPSPKWVIQRGSKVLSDQDWSGLGYQLKAHTPDEVNRLLRAANVGQVLLDRRSGAIPRHEILLRELLDGPGTEWKQVPELNWRSLEYYENQDLAAMKPGCVRVDLTRMLGRELRHCPPGSPARPH